MMKIKKLYCDLCVIGGGLSGLSAAISAAREGIKVVLMHERPVLGGNALSEIRMWVSNAHVKDNRETGIIEEICLESLYRNPNKNYAIWDTILYDFVRREENITLLLNCTCMDAVTESACFRYGRSKKIESVTGYQMTTQLFYEVHAKYFSDCSGDSILAPLTGAEFRYGRESKDEYGYVKNSGNFDSKKWDLDFLGFLPGKRESRRMCGEYMITQRDISDGRVFEDEVAFGGWPIDDHYPGGFYHKGVPNTDIHTPAPYSIPYRSLYSKNIDNLFFAGRNISMTHLAMSSIRIMATCSLLGQAVGKAAALSTKHNLSPHDIYLKHLSELQDLLLNEDSFLPTKTRKISEVCKAAKLNVGADTLRNGQDRAHRIYNTDESNYAYYATPGKEICYSFDASFVEHVHVVSCSDLNRKSLPGSTCEQRYVMRSNHRLGSPVMHMPNTLCKEFALYAEKEGKRRKLFHMTLHNSRSASPYCLFAVNQIICPSITYWVSCTSAYSLGATVVFADVDPNTLCIDPAKLETKISSKQKLLW